MFSKKPLTKLLIALACTANCAWAAQSVQQFHYTVGPGASISIFNEFGPVVVQAAPGREVVLKVTTYSGKVEIDKSQNGNRIELRSHILPPATPDEARVDYQVQVPADAIVMLRSADGPLRAAGLHGDVSLQGESAPVEVRDFNSGHLHIHTVDGPVTLTSVANSYVDVTSVGGTVILNGVSGPQVTVNSGRGLIRYTGDFGASGSYSLTNHSGNIDVLLPASASVDITARSINGKVQNDFPFQPKSHTSFAAAQGRTYSGQSNAGASSVSLSSFNGTITVKQQ